MQKLVEEKGNVNSNQRRSHREHGSELGLIERWIDVDRRNGGEWGLKYCLGIHFRLEDELSH